MKRIFCIFPAVLLCMSLVMAPAVSVYAEGNRGHDFVIELILNGTYDKGQVYTDMVGDDSFKPFEELPVLKPDNIFSQKLRYYTTVTNTDDVYSECLGTSDTDESRLFMFSYDSTGYCLSYLNQFGSLGVVYDCSYNSTYNTVCFDEGEYTDYIIHDGYSITYLTVHNNEVMSSLTRYYVMEDGTSSYYKYLNDMESQEPDPPVTPSEPVDILDMANVALLFSVSILTAVSDNPFLAFILAGSLVTVCVYVLRQLKIVTSN